ncbi:MAG TPA: TAXI family TRAP transporter solute-binding subunit [Burkholderiaceae bacterium]
MSPKFRHTLVSARDLLITAGPLIVVTLVLMAVAYWLLQPNPPRHMVLATGGQRGAYAEFGARYAKLLAKEGIKVELRHTQGSIENLALLRDANSGVDVAFVQGGVEGLIGNEDAEQLKSLGSLFHEPVWLFYREDAARRQLKSPELANLAQLAGWRVQAGTDGSGVRVLVERLLETNTLDPAAFTLLKDDTTPAVVSFLEGRSDAIVFVSAPESLMVQMLLRTPGVRLFDFVQSEAYARRLAYLSPVVLPRGIIDLARDQPPRDVRMIAPTAMLVARDGTHPALVQLLVQAAAQVHGDAGWFQHKGDFPTTRNTTLPLSPEAARFYKDGRPFLQRYLPFWLANLIERMAVVLISMIAVLIPLSRVVPPLYTFRIRSRVFRWYGQLRALEDSIGKRPPQELHDDLVAIERKVERVHVPLSYAEELYSLRSHIDMVRSRLPPVAGGDGEPPNDKGRE